MNFFNVESKKMRQMSKEKRNINFPRKIALLSRVVTPPGTKGLKFAFRTSRAKCLFVTGREATRDQRGAFSLGSYYDPRLKVLLSQLVIRPVTKGWGFYISRSPSRSALGRSPPPPNRLSSAVVAAAASPRRARPRCAPLLRRAAPLLPDTRAAPFPAAGELDHADVRPHRRASPSPTRRISSTRRPSPTRHPSPTHRPPALIPPQRRPRPSSSTAAPGPPPRRRPPPVGMPHRRRHRLSAPSVATGRRACARWPAGPRGVLPC
jgi:hypothetical protein